MTYAGTTKMTDAEWMLSKVAIVLRSWKLVAFGTVALTSAALLFVFLFTKPTYTARMIVPLSPQVHAIISAGIFGSGLSISQELAPTTRLYAVSLSSTDPEAARAELQRAFGQIVEASKPSPSQRLRILAHIESTNSALAELKGLKETTLRSTTHVRDEIENLELKLSHLQLLLDGIRPDEVPQPPGNAIKSWQPLSARMAIVAFLGSLGLMSFLAIFRRSR